MMPRRDGTGPLGQGAMTGRGLGVCKDGNKEGNRGEYGSCLGRGLGFGRRRDRGIGRNFDEEK